VIAYNQKNTQQYTVVGGGAGTVAAAGGWLQGGGLSTGLERNYGFGVDQLLAIEMVLPDGSHVKFGPTKWQSAPGFLYPRTTLVEGQCNRRVSADESAWQWGPCSSRVSFSDLWFAVRGGGGGTFGIVTAVYAQLHDLKPIYALTINTTAFSIIGYYCAVSGCDVDRLQNLWFDFLVDFWFQPELIGLSVEASNSCGSPAATASVDGSFFLMCEGQLAATQVLAAWSNYVLTQISPQLPTLTEATTAFQSLLTSTFVNSYAEFLLSPLAGGFPNVPQGRIPDNPPPATQPDNQAGQCWSANAFPSTSCDRRTTRCMFSFSTSCVQCT